MQSLTNLKRLDLSYNLLSGNISDWIGGLNALEHLILSHNNISGSLPNELGQIGSLVNVELDYNQLNGEFPQWISNLNNLNVLKLNNNNFSGNLFTQELELVKMNNFELKDLDEQNQSKIADIKKKYDKAVKDAEKEFGLKSPQYDFAVADKNADGKLSNTEIVSAGYSFDEATKLATDASKPKPAQPKVAKNAQVDADILPSNPGDRSMGAFSQGGGT